MNLTSSNEGKQYLMSIFIEYLKEKHMNEIKDLKYIAIERNESGFVVNVDAMVLVQDHAWLSWYLLNDAIHLLELFNAALVRVVYEVLDGNQSLREKPRCIIRLTSVPICDETSRTRMPRCADVGHLLSISATVLHTAPLQVLQYQRQYECRKCTHMFLCAVSESDSSYTITPPGECPLCHSVLPHPVLAHERSNYRNRQQLRIQEQTRYLAVGMMPRSIIVILDDDLVDCAQPGDDVIVIGTVIRRWKKHRANELCDAELVILANNIQVTNHSLIESQSLNCEAKDEFELFWQQYGSDKWSARNAIISQMCPLIYGMYYLKLALALVLTGSSGSNFNGLKVRGESHMLLIGDPGTAKSQFLKFAAKIVPRSVITTGIGSTSAGLTVTAVKESGDWSLEAGALVLADGGLCCIDEFGGIREHDKTAIHEAMEQQTISVAKAGIVCKLRTRCSIIAATNPKGSYDLDRSISCNTAIASPLLSRFDLIFLLLDNCNETWDRRVSDFILNQQSGSTGQRVFNVDKLKAYFLFIKSNYHPRMTHQASVVLENYYSWMRKHESTKSLDRITMRFLESLIRLSQSHARLMMRDEVILEDAIVTVAVMESTVYGSSILSTEQQLPSEFPDNAEEEYQLLEDTIVRKLGIKKLDRNTSTNVTGRAIIKRKYPQTQPIAMKRREKSDNNEKKLLNRSVLDNFHIATQMKMDEKMNDSEVLEVTLAEGLLEEEEEDDSERGMRNNRVQRNMFTDSISHHPDLTDADFDL